MSDSSIPPKPPATNVLNAAAQPAKPQGTQRLLDEAAPVRKAPADIGNPPVKLEGRVVSQDRETGETRIATARGEITVNSDKPMPKDATVSVELTRGKDGGLMAQITLLREKVQAAETPDLPPPLPAKLPPAPPLKPGDIVTALVMRDEAVTPPQAPDEADIPLQRAAQLLERLTPDMLRQLPKPLPVPNEVILQLAAAPDKLAALQKLPPEQQQAILNYLTKPEVAAKLSQMIQLPPLPAAQTSSLPVAQPSSPSAAPPAPQTTPVETDLPLLPVPTGKGTGNAPPPAGVGALKGLLPLIESLQNGNAAAPLMPRMGGTAAPAMPQGLQGLIPSMSQLRIVSVTPQGETPPVPQQGQILGEVEFVTTNGQPSIRAGGQSFLLRLPANLPIGTQVLFEATPMTPQQVMTSFQLDALRQMPAPAAFTPLWSTTWPALQETMDFLGAMTGNPVAQPVLDSIPSPTPRLVPTALFFLAALRSGAVESWLGEGTLQSLRQAGKSALAERLTGDFGRISAQSKEPVSGEWRAISMPMMHDGEIGQMQFYIRRQNQDDAPEQDDDARAAQPTRFILNLHLSRMGDMQLDGLLRKNTFDLILRSADALPESMRRELMGSFAKGLKQAEMEGGISFQTRAQKWVTIDTPLQGTTA